MHIKRRKKRIIWTVLVLLLGMGSAAFALMGRHPTDMGQQRITGRQEPAISVKTIQPKRDNSYQVTTKHIAMVEPYNQANLRARASGTVSTVSKGINQNVRRGEVLIEIDVPDLRQDVLVKKGEIEQRLREVQKARDEVKIARAHVDVAIANVELRRREVGLAVATRDLRKKRLERYRELLAKEAIVAEVFDEQERDWKVAVATVDAADGAVQKALADQKEMEASLDGKMTDIRVKESLVEIARYDLLRAETLADFARVVAPFDGVITQRNVDPGTFVQNATSGNSESLLTVSRLDIVTIVTRVPDNEAPFISTNTQVHIELDNLPGVVITGHVTRFSRSVQNSDRTMRVEVDVYNDGAKEYAAFKRQVLATVLSAFASRSPFESVPLFAGAVTSLKDWQNSPGDPVPIWPWGEESDSPHPQILAGSSGKMELHLGRASSTYVIPSSAVYSINGKPYILLVQNGISVQTPVRIEVDDGAIAKVDLELGGHHGGSRELTGKEVIIASRQIEIGNGRRVLPTATEWELDPQ